MAKPKQPWFEAPREGLAPLETALRRSGVGIGHENNSPAPSARRGEISSNEKLALDEAARIVLRREKKGRGGKTVTVIEGLGLRAAQLEQLARDLRKGLGCGSVVEGTDIIVQGDMVARIQPRLEQLGAKRIIVGN